MVPWRLYFTYISITIGSSFVFGYHTGVINAPLSEFNSGAYTVVAPNYLSEIAPLSSRGAAGTMNQFVIVFAILLSQILGLSQVMGTETLWPYLLALLILRGKNYDVQMELDSIQHNMEYSGDNQLSMKNFFQIPYLRWGLFVALIPHFGQQLSGINGILYYSVPLFESIGLSNKDATLVNLGVGATILLGTIISIFIIDRGGRRVLLLIGFSICLFSLISFTTVLAIQKFTGTLWLTYIAILIIYLFVSGFSIGPGN
ncbi:unnamed protein product [Trichobilharzia regenti]|nr:unnamed protein product [Trichobilharzia regenti]